MSARPTNPSFVAGVSDKPLWTITLGSLIETQARQYGERNAAVFPWQKVSLTYRDLLSRSKLVAKALLAAGLKHGDCVAITAGNCYQYIEVFLGAARIGCPVVVLNSTYTPSELLRAVTFTSRYQNLLCTERSTHMMRRVQNSLRSAILRSERGSI
jgi:acyl-CoA synthetase (AMP-forming)/AMP-acid ligase II